MVDVIRLKEQAENKISSLVEKTSLVDAIRWKEQVENRISSLEAEISDCKKKLNMYQKELYKVTIREAHIKEIYRLAEIHFPRLQRRSELTSNDIMEIEKWVSRAKSLDGLVDIVNAFNELAKYQPGDIRRNFYALVQKIISEGPIKGN